MQFSIHNVDIVCSSDFTIKLVDISSGDTKKFEGHEAPVLSVALDPKEEFLVSVLNAKKCLGLTILIKTCEFLLSFQS